MVKISPSLPTMGERIPPVPKANPLIWRSENSTTILSHGGLKGCEKNLGIDCGNLEGKDGYMVGTTMGELPAKW